LIPPILARLLARKPHGRPLTDDEIAKAAGLSIDQVFLIGHMTDWSQVSVADARSFLRGCGVDFCDGRQMDRVRGYLPFRSRQPTTWKYLRSSPEWKTKYAPLLLRYRASIVAITNQTK
jgi:hypothetical protein